MRSVYAAVVFALIPGVSYAQPALSEPPEFPQQSPGPNATQQGEGCFWLASGLIQPGDVDWIRITIPRRTLRTVVDLDFADPEPRSSIIASVVGGSSGFNQADNNAARDNLCGLGASSTPVGSPRDSAVDLGGTPLGAVINIGITGAGDTGFTGAHSQTFSYDIWVYVEPVSCTSDADCADGLACTNDVCNTGTGLCANTPRDELCDDGRFCNGVEWCSPTMGCRPGTAPRCNDGVDCTWDYCDAALDACVFEPDDYFCEDGSFCNGEEWCDPQLDCQPGEPLVCDDGVDCTVDVCDDDTGECFFTADDDACDDGLFCNGEEWCDSVKGCRGGEAPCADGPCDEQRGCVECLHDEDCDDGDFCNGGEFCDDDGLCADGDPPCSDDEFCDADRRQCMPKHRGPSLDIRPGECPNRVVTQAQGQWAAALMGSSTFDVRKVDPTSLVLSRSDGVGGKVLAQLMLAGKRPQFVDVATPYAGELCGCHALQGDGMPDLVMKFENAEVVRALELWRLSGDVSLELRLAGRMNDGTHFEASDCVLVRAPRVIKAQLLRR